MDEKIENFINNKNNKETYLFKYENNDNDDEYKEDVSEELDYNKIYSKII